MNQTSDAIYTQIILPKGIDTSFPLTVDVMYLIVTGGPGDFSLISSVLPLEVVGVLEADPTGGVPPIARTITNTETVTDNAGQIVSIATVNATDQTRLRKITFGPYDISSHYEGDAVLFRLEMEDDGPNNVDLVIMGYEVSGVFWTLGEIL